MTEHEEQVALMRLVEMHKGRWPELGMLFAVPNGGDRNVIVARKLKAEGVFHYCREAAVEWIARALYDSSPFEMEDKPE